jgi:uncharacterized membrane protein YdjX (TVP38/TMEM64 family)
LSARAQPRIFDLMKMTAAVRRYARLVRWISVALIVLGLLLIARHVPVEAAVQALQGQIDKLGLWGPVLFGLVYVILVLLLVPGSALGLAAGALFGPLLGTVVVSLASTTAAALAFLISRYLARDRVARVLARSARLGAIDRAVSEGGWKIVALLRLSPAVPFTLQNYLYGLTGIHFWPYVLTSWLTMLPGTFLYVYLGHAGRVGLEAAAGARQRSPAEWAFLGLGLVATVAVTVYVTRLARKAIREQAPLAPAEALPTGPEPERWPWDAMVAALLAVVVLVAAGVVEFHPDFVRQLVGARR